MGSTYVDGSPSWDSIGSNMFSLISGAPAKAAQQTLTIEQIKALRQKELRDKTIFDTNTQTGNSFADALPTDPPMSTRTVVGPMVGNPDLPADTAGIPTADVQYLDPAVKARYDKELPAFRNLQRAQAYSDPSKLPDVYARSRVGVGGAPEDPAERERLGVMMKGTFDKSTPSNYVAVNPNTGETVRILGPGDGVYTADGKAKLADLAPPGSVVTKAADTAASAKPRTIMDDDASMWNGLVKANNMTIGGRPPDPNQTRELAAVMERQFPGINKVMSDAVGNTVEIKNFVEKNMPRTFQPLVEHIANTLYPAPAPAAPAPVQAPLSQTGVTAADISNPAKLDAPLEVAAATPILTPEQRIRGTTGTDTNILVRAPADKATVDAARAIQMTQHDRGIIENMMQVRDGPNGPEIPVGAYVPSWSATIARETLGTGIISDTVLNLLDPRAKEYFQAGRSWIEPVLRIASGAVTPPQEVTGYMNRFIPDASDSDAIKAQKLTRMRVWEEATRSAANANDAINKILANPKTDPEARAMAEKMRVKAMDAGSLTQPVSQLGQLGSARGTAPVTAATGPAAATAPSARARAVGGGAPARTPDQILRGE